MYANNSTLRNCQRITSTEGIKSDHRNHQTVLDFDYLIQNKQIPEYNDPSGSGWVGCCDWAVGALNCHRTARKCQQNSAERKVILTGYHFV